MPSIAEISHMLGLSKATVSRAFDLRNCDKVRKETRQRIFSFCEELDYHPTFTGRSFSTGKTFRIGVLAKNYSLGQYAPAPLFNLCIGAIGTAVQQRGYALTMLYLNEQDNSSSQIINFLKSSVADGYIILSQMIDERVLEAVVKCRQPVVNMDYVQSNISGISAVVRDSVSAYRTAWAETTAEERKSSVFVHFGRSLHKRECLKQGAPTDVKLRDVILPCSKVNTLTSYRDAKYALNRCVDELVSYKLLWCSSDIIALAVMDTLREHGIAPGDRIKVIGFDNIEGNTVGFDTPVLSTVDPCWAECGRVLADVIIREIQEGCKFPSNISVKSKFIFRSSFRRTDEKKGR